ncbi:MAG: hypothetical protein N2117_08975 [Anaerolineales bacterium]|nr:hypothetical protein [Anaerolineales bacterium]MCX7755364.1 hypothetical protein [Anaerolineales bacterium]MDW8279103.1 hypothetical protein [Anaerolineales bacterium]
MPLPTIVFGVLLSTLYGGLYHLIRGGKTRKLLLFLVLSWAGFWVGDTVGWLLNWTFAPVGMMNAGMGTVGAFVFLVAGDLASMVTERSRKP